MLLRLYNSLSQRVETVVPQHKNSIALYCCGITVYDHCHLGHGRIFLIYDLLVRILKEQRYDVFFVRNITDIDDKIIHKAHEQQRSCSEVTAEYIQSMHTVMDQLGCQHPDREPLATQSIAMMISMIQTLIQKGHAYEVEGEVFFEVGSFEHYGCLSQQKIEDLAHGTRLGEISSHKKHPADFTLWKPSKEHEPSWDSPWGSGRPGWHIECSAMIEDIFKRTIDIHLGGADLKFPHHENEIAQSEACFNRQLARYWVHGGFVTVDEIKMSKSLGNFHYLHDVLAELGSEALRYFYLSTHYRQPLAFTAEKVQHAQRSWNSLNRLLAPWLPAHQEHLINQEVYQDLMMAVLDDMNTPELLARLHKYAKKLEHYLDHEVQAIASTLIDFLNRMLGLTVVAERLEALLLPQAIKELLEERSQARKNKDYKQADYLRQQIALLGFQVIDTPKGQVCLAI
jgi:cysteinyl-tRNA synthetase